jgi:YD repeat-containing protein
MMRGGNLAITLDWLGSSFKINDANGNLLEVIDAERKKTYYRYNEVGDKLKQVDSTGSKEE